jgi:seryl-tRNA synthetase
MSKVMSDHQESELFTYDRTWEEIELMLDKAEKKRNQWLMKLHSLPKQKNKQSIQCLRNIKALEGVIKTLKWVLGSKDIEHPLD